MGAGGNKKNSFVKKTYIILYLLNLYLLEFEKFGKRFYRGSAFVQYILFPD